MQDSQIKGGEMHWKCWLGLHNWRMEEKANHLTRYCTRCGKASKNFEEVVAIMEMMSSLNERRAEFVYNAARLAAIAVQASVIPVSWEEREDAFKRQFLGVIERQCGEQRSKSLEELHEGWMQAYFAMGWVFGEVYDRENKIHPDLVPYAQLDPLERDKDAVFVALCEIARLWIR